MHKTVNIVKYLLLLLGIVIFSASMKDYVLADKLLSNQETGYSVFVEDSAQLMTTEQMSELHKKMFSVTRYCDVAFVSANEHDYDSTGAFAQAKGHELFGDGNAVLFVIDMKCREIYIWSVGEAFKKVTTEKAHIITDNVYQFASDKAYFRCAESAFEQIYDVLGGTPIPAPMKYISNFFIAAIVAVILNYLLVIFTSGRIVVSSGRRKNGVEFKFQVLDVKNKVVKEQQIESPAKIFSDSPHSGGLIPQPVLTPEQKKQIFDQKCREVFEKGDNKYSDNPFAGIELYYDESDDNESYSSLFDFGDIFEHLPRNSSSGYRSSSSSSGSRWSSGSRSSSRWSSGSRSSSGRSSGSRSSGSRSSSSHSRSGGGGHRF